jgi:predicted ester cyclase
VSKPLDIQFAREFLAKLHSCVNAHDAAAIASLCTEDVIWDDPAATKPLNGRDAVRRFHRDGLFRALPDVTIELIDGPYLSADGQGAAARTRIRGTMTGPLNPPGFAPTGKTVEFETAEFSRFRDGLLCHHTVILNMLDLARQIGAAPTSGGLAERLGVRFQHFAARRMKRRAEQ